MCAVSAVASTEERPCWRSQYCMTIAMLAAPQPSFSCLMKGTSSQMVEGWAESMLLEDKITPQMISSTTFVSLRCVFRPQALRRADFVCTLYPRLALRAAFWGRLAANDLPYGDDDQDQRSNGQDDQQQVAITKSAGCEIRLGELRP